MNAHPTLNYRNNILLRDHQDFSRTSQQSSSSYFGMDRIGDLRDLIKEKNLQLKPQQKQREEYKELRSMADKGEKMLNNRRERLELAKKIFEMKREQVGISERRAKNPTVLEPKHRFVNLDDSIRNRQPEKVPERVEFTLEEPKSRYMLKPYDVGQATNEASNQSRDHFQLQEVVQKNQFQLQDETFQMPQTQKYLQTEQQKVMVQSQVVPQINQYQSNFSSRNQQSLAQGIRSLADSLKRSQQNTPTKLQYQTQSLELLSKLKIDRSQSQNKENKSVNMVNGQQISKQVAERCLSLLKFTKLPHQNSIKDKLEEPRYSQLPMNSARVMKKPPLIKKVAKPMSIMSPQKNLFQESLQRASLDIDHNIPFAFDSPSSHANDYLQNYQLTQNNFEPQVYSPIKTFALEEEPTQVDAKTQELLRQKELLERDLQQLTEKEKYIKASKQVTDSTKGVTDKALKQIEDDISERMKEKSKRWNKLLVDGFKLPIREQNPLLIKKDAKPESIKIKSATLRNLGNTFKSIEEKYALYEQRMKIMQDEIEQYNKKSSQYLDQQQTQEKEVKVDKSERLLRSSGIFMMESPETLRIKPQQQNCIRPIYRLVNLCRLG